LAEPSVPRTRKNTTLVLAALLPAVTLTSVGILHPSIAFGLTVVFWVLTGVFPRKAAYQAISLRIILFLGSMLSLSSVLEETGALAAVVKKVLPAVQGLSPFWLIVSFVLLSGTFANILDNSVAAVLLSPTGILLAQTGAISVGSDALLMAVAAGASLGIVLPLHQATVVTMAAMDLNRKIFIRNGAAVVLPAGLLAAAVITLVWT
jgi:di/tricarboxylate transporter